MAQRLLYVCEGGDCTECGSGDIFESLKDQISAHDPNEERVKVRRYPCFGGCEVAINLTVFPDRVFYSQVKPDDIAEIVEHVIGDGEPVQRLTGHVEQDVEDIIWDMLDSPY